MNRMKKILSLILTLGLMLNLYGALAEPNLSLQDTAVRPGEWEKIYAEILEERAGSIQAYQDYVQSVTSIPSCRPVGFQDLNEDGFPELLFLDLEENPDYGFQVGRLWIYTQDGSGVRCVLTIQPEIDDLLYSWIYLAEHGMLTIWLSDTEMDWVYQLRPDLRGNYTVETTLIEQMDFSGEGPDMYILNGKKITAKKWQAQKKQIQAAQGRLIGSLMIDDGGSGLTHTQQEAREALSSGSITQAAEENNREIPYLEKLPELIFTEGRFTAGQKFEVYSAPSARAWRGAGGKAAITSGSEIFTAGEKDGWILILYELNSGVIRAGYIDSGKITGPYDSMDSLSFPEIRMKLKTTCEMTEDPIRGKSMIGKLKKGTQVTCLARFRGWIYIEAKVSGKTARGFVEPSSLEWVN